MRLIHDMCKLPAIAIIGIGALAFSASGAAARIVCNDEGECWHTHSEFDFPPGVRMTVHPDNWRWSEHEKYRGREHEGKGYWKGGEWKEF